MSDERDAVIQALTKDPGFVDEDEFRAAAIPAGVLVFIRKAGAKALKLILTRDGVKELARVVERIITSRRQQVSMTLECPRGGGFTIEMKITAKELAGLIRATCGGQEKSLAQKALEKA